jgi:hypothetical protein
MMRWHHSMVETKLQPLPRERAPAPGGRRTTLRVPDDLRQQRLSWPMDIQIAACAYTNGYGITTENRREFEVLRDAIATLDPGAPPLGVRGP